MKVAVIGEKNFTVGFKLSGVREVYEVTEEDYVEKFEDCFGSEGVGIIIIDEKYLKKLPSRIKRKIEKTISPVVVGISETDVGGADIATLIKRCLGVDLWKM